MDTKNTMHEQISAFADGEVDESQIEATLAMLRTSEGKTAWDDYHRIGDALRSDDMAFSMSDDFSAKLMRRLDDEPAIVAKPRRQQPEQADAEQDVRNARTGKRFMLPGVAAAAMALLTVVAAQYWVGINKGVVEDSTIAATSSNRTPMLANASVAIVAASSGASAPQERNLMRDPGIDEYLLAHQRFSPSLYSTAQYARSATFAVDSDK